MLLELYDFGHEPRTLHLIAGLLLGLAFGMAAQISRFCLRRAVAGAPEERGTAGAIWLAALASAAIGFAVLNSAGLVELGDHRFLSPEIPVAAILLGGLAFGVGMVLTRGCVSRLTVLSATGNLRAVVVLMAFAVTAHATMKGVLAPARIAIGSFTLDMPFSTVVASPLGHFALIAPIAALAATLAWYTRPGVRNLVLGAIIGLVAVGGWAATSVLLFDEFEPLPVQTAAFTAPWSDTLFWTIASSAVPANFGVGFVGGVLGGSFLSAAFRRELKLSSFESPAQTVRYVAGGILMGTGGTLAGGCTVGAGLSGVATGSVAAILALSSIALAGWIAGEAFRQPGTAPAAA